MNYSKFHNRLSKGNTERREIDIQFYFYLITIGLLWPSLVEGVNLFEVLEYSDYSIKVIMYDAKGGM
jgi:hypothetical protein